MTEIDIHARCVGGCMLAASQPALARRAAKYGLDLPQLDQLMGLLEGRCMICHRCHAMVIDTSTRAAQRRPRGLLCRFCKQRVAIHEGAFADNNPFYTSCRCQQAQDPDWVPRLQAATAQYLDRTAHLDECATNRHRLDTLIEDVAARGADPAHIWSGAPRDELPVLPVEPAPPEDDFGGLPPLARVRCPDHCRDHRQHLYIACFDHPTRLHDADTRNAVMHYVGWTRQRPPLRRVEQHGAICRESLVTIVPGTLAEEALLKEHGRCPKCQRPLRYH